MVRKVNTIINQIKGEMQKYIGVSEEEMQERYPACKHQASGVYSSVTGNCLLNDLPVLDADYIDMYEETASTAKGMILDMNGGVGTLCLALKERKANDVYHFDVNFHLYRFADKILGLKTFRSINAVMALKYGTVVYLNTHHKPIIEDVISTAYNTLVRNGKLILSKDMKDEALSSGFYNFEGLMTSVGFKLIEEKEHIYIFERVR